MASLDFDLEESQFRSWYTAQAVALEDACAALTARVAAVVTQAGGVDITKVEGRVKDVDECVRKFVRKYRPALEESNTPYDIETYITDLIGVRVVCLYEDELEKIAQIVRAHFAVIDVTDKVSAVESTEASFGYKGLHLDLRLSVAERDLPEHAAYAEWPFELQVRTIIQDSWSVLDHKIKYKIHPGPAQAAHQRAVRPVRAGRPRVPTDPRCHGGRVAAGPRRNRRTCNRCRRRFAGAHPRSRHQ